VKILVLANTSWYLWRFRSALIDRLKDQGHEVIAIAPPDEYSARIPCEFHPLPIKRGSNSLLKDGTMFLRLLKILRVRRPHVLLTYTPKPNVFGALAAKALGVRVVCNISGLGSSMISGGIFSRLMFGLYRISVGNADFVFFQNKDDLDIFLSKGIVRSDRVGLLPGSGVDLTKYPFSPRLRAADGIFRFVMIARLIRDKGVFEYVDAALRVTKQVGSPIEFVLVGGIDEGNQSSLSSQEIDRIRAQGAVVVMGHVDDVKSEIERADCVVLPSYREGLPRTLLEGAALGRPLIASDVEGCKEIVDNTINGYLCEARSSASLAESMLRMYALDSAELRQLGESSRRKVEDFFSEEIVFDEYLKRIDSFAR
jgi:glycosyltransferase involved in cell wall biosynthesis